jgi:hypothetical protein
MQAGFPELRFAIKFGSGGSGGVSDVRIIAGAIFVERFIGAATCCPEKIERSEWRWRNDRFLLASSPVYVPYGQAPAQASPSNSPPRDVPSAPNTIDAVARVLVGTWIEGGTDYDDGNTPGEKQCRFNRSGNVPYLYSWLRVSSFSRVKEKLMNGSGEEIIESPALSPRRVRLEMQLLELEEKAGKLYLKYAITPRGQSGYVYHEMQVKLAGDNAIQVLSDECFYKDISYPACPAKKIQYLYRCKL